VFYDDGVGADGTGLFQKIKAGYTQIAHDDFEQRGRSIARGLLSPQYGAETTVRELTQSAAG